MVTEKRLIDAEPICEECGLKGCYNCQLCKVGKAPTVDAVEVVRCKDCRYRCSNKECGRFEHATYSRNAFYPEDNDFCSYGERKNNEVIAENPL